MSKIGRTRIAAADMGQEPATADGRSTSVAAVLPSYKEPPAAIETTVRALLTQTVPFSAIVLVDDGSPTPATLGNIADPRVLVLTMKENVGISAARNAGVLNVQTEFVACINIDVLPDSNWLETCADYLVVHPKAGIVATRIIPLHPEERLARWRMMFHERPFPAQSGVVPWMAGHAMLIRLEAFHAVGGFDERMRRFDEDVDFCHRVRDAGWEVHFLSESGSRSIQEDTVEVLGRTELNRSGWTRDRRQGFLRAAYGPTKRTILRIGRHVLSGRFGFLWIEVRIWMTGIRILRNFYESKGSG